jgi:poly(A) polymerase
MKLDIPNKILIEIGKIADTYEFIIYAVGGYVRDLLLNKECKDIDILVVGDGIKFANLVSKSLGNSDVVIYERFGTAMLNYGDTKYEFVGARKESYSPDSRNPDVFPGTLEDDLARRDFTINTFAISLNNKTYGQMIDLFKGLEDLGNGIIKTPLEPERTFSDDPLRMIRAIRFASTLRFKIDQTTFDGIKKSADRIKIISQERITDEIIKIIMSPKPSIGFKLLNESRLINLIFPEIAELAMTNAQNEEGIEYHHKNLFLHSLQVMDNLAGVSDNLWLRFAGLVHDIGKPKTRSFSKELGWSFHGHEEVGARMIPPIFKRMKLPFDKIEYIKKLVRLHLRPIALIDEDVTDSAVRRLLFEAADEIDDLMALCRADITSKNLEKVEQFKKNYEYLEKRIKEVEEKDRIRNFQPPVKGDEIMQMFGLTPGRMVGELKDSLTDAILDGIIPNEKESAIGYLANRYKEISKKISA